MPIGMAAAIGRTEGGLAVWRLLVHDADTAGRWVIIDRRFVPVESAPTDNRAGVAPGRAGGRGRWMRRPRGRWPHGPASRGIITAGWNLLESPVQIGEDPGGAAFPPFGDDGEG
jgi:hypothetical protein